VKIRSIAHKGLRRLYENGSAKGVSADALDDDNEIVSLNLEDYR